MRTAGLRRADPEARLEMLFDELGRRQMTNVLVEGGGRLLGSLFDARLIDEVHVFIAPKLAGGGESPGPIAGRGVDTIALPSRWRISRSARSPATSMSTDESCGSLMAQENFSDSL